MADDQALALEGGCTCGAVRYRLLTRPMFVHCVLGRDPGALCLTSRNRAGFAWGDSDDVYFVIPAEDLARRRFDRVTFNCGLG